MNVVNFLRGQRPLPQRLLVGAVSDRDEATTTTVFVGAVSDRDEAASTTVFVGAVSDHDGAASRLIAVSDR